MDTEVKAVLEMGAVDSAQKLLGWVMVVNSPQGRMSGRIVETEAYHQDDAASHSFRGLTKRTAPMFEKAGTIYVYFTYGMHHCVNIVCGPKGRGEAVLIRALEPIEGLDVMNLNRGGVSEIMKLTNGPGKVAQALGLTTQHSGMHLDRGYITLIPQDQDFAINQTKRVGITLAVNQPWRFYIAGNPFVSRP